MGYRTDLQLWQDTKALHPNVFIFVRSPGDQWLITYGDDAKLLVATDARGRLGLKPDVLVASLTPFVTVPCYSYTDAYELLWRAGHPVLVVWTEAP